LEELSDLDKALDESKDGFLYLQSSSTVKKLLEKAITRNVISKDSSSSKPNNDDQPLVDHLEKEMKRFKGEEMIFNQLAYLSHPFRDSSGMRPVSEFHTDGSSLPSFLGINIWMAKKDVKGQPLAFVRPESVIPGDFPESGERYDTIKIREGMEYVMVKEMKEGEMLVFESSNVIHGSPTLVDPEHRGSRESIALAFMNIPQPTYDDRDEMGIKGVAIFY
jgi:hypothetical protein